MKKPCKRCDGTGYFRYSIGVEPCLACENTGTIEAELVPVEPCPKQPQEQEHK
jgi:DnaJ-class molecular chaperone